jgi:hypothetical protein
MIKPWDGFTLRAEGLRGRPYEIAEASPCDEPKFHRRADGSTRQESRVFEFTAWPTALTSELMFKRFSDATVGPVMQEAGGTQLPRF